MESNLKRFKKDKFRNLHGRRNNHMHHYRLEDNLLKGISAEKILSDQVDKVDQVDHEPAVCSCVHKYHFYHRMH